jgi:serine/threonine protein kinase
VLAGGYAFVPGDGVPPNPVAFKVFKNSQALAPAMRESILEEARLGLRLDHPHLIQLHGVLQIPQRGLAIVLELAHGGSLRAILDNAAIALSWEVRLKWLIGISEGVSKLHSLSPRPVIHRDLKAANVLLSSTDIASAVPKVCDFGVATIMETMATAMSGAGGGMTGSLAWKAPETFRGNYSPASDVFSLAVVDFEVLARQPPWVGISVPEVIEKVKERFDPTDRRVLRSVQRGITIEQQQAGE